MTHVQMTRPPAAATVGAVRLEHLTKVFESRGAPTRAVDDVSLSIEPGEFVTLLGPSGCGKTTLLRIIGGFEQATSGVVFLDDEDVTSTAPNHRPMSMVFQSYALFPHMSVRQNVAYGLRIKKTPRAQVDDEVDSVLATMSLTQLADRAPHQLSGGQQQRVALARALVMKPRVLLFDEPLSNLDAQLRIQMRNEIRRLQRRLGITSIFVTHDQDEAITMSDRVVVMKGGRFEQVDTPERVYRRPATTFVADFVGRANFLEAHPIGAPRPGRVVVHVLGSTLEVDSHPDIALDGSATLVVRPESLRVEQVAAAERDGHEVRDDVGQIVSTTFHGASVDYVVETDSGNVLVRVPDPAASELLETTDVVRLQIADTDRAWLIPMAD